MSAHACVVAGADCGRRSDHRRKDYRDILLRRALRNRGCAPLRSAGRRDRGMNPSRGRASQRESASPRFPGSVRYLGRDAAIQIGQQRRRIGRIAPHETSRPRPQPIVGIGILAFKHPAEVDAIVCGIDERVAQRLRRDLERRPLHGIGFQHNAALDPQFGRRIRRTMRWRPNCRTHHKSSAPTPAARKSNWSRSNEDRGCRAGAASICDRQARPDGCNGRSWCAAR